TSLAKCYGETSATFSTTASGTPQANGKFAFVWKKGSTTISPGPKYVITSDATSSTLTINNLVDTDTATYSVDAGGLCTTNTQPANLTVNKLTAALNDANACLTSAIESAKFTGTTTGATKDASGDTDLQCSWKLDGDS